MIPVSRYSSLRPVAVVIGAGGMGVAAARRLSQSFPVLLADLDSARADQVADMLTREGGHVTAIGCDVTSAEDVARLVARVEEIGGLRALAHIAGLSPSMADFDTILRVNLLGVMRVATALLPLAGTGTAAVLVASLAAHNFHPGEQAVKTLRDPADPQFLERLRRDVRPAAATPELAYQLSKWGVVDFARRRAHAWGERGARILSLSPGLIASPQGARENNARPSKKVMLERSPLRREGTMLEVVDVIEFLISDRASFLSGTDILVDGGLASVLA